MYKSSYKYKYFELIGQGRVAKTLRKPKLLNPPHVTLVMYQGKSPLPCVRKKYTRIIAHTAQKNNNAANKSPSNHK